VTNPVGWAILAAAAIAGTVAVYDALTISVEEATDAMNEFRKKYKDMDSDLKNHQNYVNNLADSYYELSKGVDSISGKILVYPMKTMRNLFQPIKNWQRCFLS
jgi:hypothetical protein